MLLKITLFYICLCAIKAAPPPLPRRLQNQETRTPPLETNCGYESCHQTKDGFVNVHIVPHTHDDVGWLKTVDQYYYGSNSTIQKAGVEYILDSVVDALHKNKDRRFIYVETSYFWKWWIKQHDFVKSRVRKFVNNGRLEFIGGAWSMNDEAVTNYQSIIDQFTWGLRKLNDTFGTCGRPKVGWQIDPFGHSREMASIFAQLGYDGLLLGRIDFDDKKFRFRSKSPEMVWQGSDNLGNRTELFTSVMYNTYSPPPGFCFDVLCADEPIIDDKRSPDYNVDERVKEFFAYVNRVAAGYNTSNVIITMGEDFNYQHAEMWFKNLDKLILHANELQANGSKYNLIYSTPSCYLKAVHDEGVVRNIQWPVKQDDFFPYASDPDAYWTGYFTSKPTIKRFERMGNNYLQVCKQLYALTDLSPEDWVDLNEMREAMGVMQHHDAITGTEKDHVAHDYSRILSEAFDECDIITATALSKIITGSKFAPPEYSETPIPAIPFQNCLLTNISQCELSETLKNFVVTIYNPLSRVVTHPVRVPVANTAYKVTDPDGNEIPADLLPIHPSVLNIPGRKSIAKYELVFEAVDLPPLGFKSFYIATIAGDMVVKPSSKKAFNNENISVGIASDTGLINEVTMNGKTISLRQEFLYYRGAVGNNEESKNRSSGAYIFRPNGTISYQISLSSQVTYYRGNVVTEVHQCFDEWISQVLRIYKSDNHVELEWLAGPLPANESEINGRELVSVFTTGLKTESTFYTDSNGREMLKRVRDFRPTWKLSLDEPISGNYYPVTSKILIRDSTEDVEVAVLTDRAQGGSSLTDGSMELMIHRNCFHDDAFGVDENLNETAYGEGLVVRGTHYLMSGPYLHTDGMAAYERQLAQRKLMQAWTFVSPTNSFSYEEYKSNYKMQFSGMKRALPANVQILTLEPWKGMSFLIRFEHIFEATEDSKLSQPVTIDLNDLFKPFDILWYKETTLGANQWLEDNDRLKFSTGRTLEDILDLDSYWPVSYEIEHLWQFGRKKWLRNQLESNDLRGKFPRKPQFSEIVDDEFEVTLTPMQIRTFVIEFKRFQ